MTLYTDKIDLSELTLLNVKELIESLEGFDQDELELTEETLSEVLETWYEMQEEELDLDLD
jgi:Fe-S-cluster formation regulator IscX/YfhJ